MASVAPPRCPDPNRALPSLNPPTPSPSLGRFCVAIFLAALALHLGLGSVGLHHTLLGDHGFRPVQTALSSLFYLRDGLSLHYRTPVLGPPYEIPLEFPLFQAAVAGLVKATGLDLDFAGRLVSWAFFLAGLPAAYGLLGRLRVPAAHRLLILAVWLLSPLYLFFSRHFLIESTALTFSLWYLLAFDHFLERPRAGSWLAAAVCGALAGMVKVTSFVVFLVAALLLLLRAAREAGRPAPWRLAGRAVLATLVPFVATTVWTLQAAAVRQHNPEANFMSSVFGYWTFGDLALRLSPAFWVRTFDVWSGPILSEAGVALVALYFCWLRGRYRWAVAGCLAAFLSGQLIFSNLYFVHDYYFYPSGLFLAAALGFFLVELLEHPGLAAGAKALFVVVVLGLQVQAYTRTFFPEQRSNPPVPPVCGVLQAITRPDELVVVLGYDWDPFVPYYAQRPALMLMKGREHDPASVRRSIERLDRSQVGAVVIAGALWLDGGFVSQAMPSLDLGPRPLLSNRFDLGVWVPRSRQAAIRDAYEPDQHPPFTLSIEEYPDHGPHTLLARAIARHRAFERFSPRPIRATADQDFTTSSVDNREVLNAPATTEFAMVPPPGARRITAVFGLVEGAYADPAHATDGVEFVIVERRPDGTERDLFRRLLNPRWTLGDRGPRPLDLTLPADVAGEVIFRTLPGPAGNASYDWAYWGDVTIR